MVTDTQNRKQILEQMNPRKTVMDEATQRINPITGKAYEDQFTIRAELMRDLFGIYDKDMLIGYKIRPKKNDIDYIINGTDVKPIERSSDLIDYQKALARMDVREGKDIRGVKFTQQEYIKFLNDVEELIDTYNNSDNLTIRTINDAHGLDVALTQVENNRRQFSLNDLSNPYIIWDSFCTEHKTFRHEKPYTLLDRVNGIYGLDSAFLLTESKDRYIPKQRFRYEREIGSR